MMMMTNCSMETPAYSKNQDNIKISCYTLNQFSWIYNAYLFNGNMWLWCSCTKSVSLQHKANKLVRCRQCHWTWRSNPLTINKKNVSCQRQQPEINNVSHSGLHASISIIVHVDSPLFIIICIVHSCISRTFHEYRIFYALCPLLRLISSIKPVVYFFIFTFPTKAIILLHNILYFIASIEAEFLYCLYEIVYVTLFIWI